MPHRIRLVFSRLIAVLLFSTPVVAHASFNSSAAAEGQPVLVAVEESEAGVLEGVCLSTSISGNSGTSDVIGTSGPADEVKLDPYIGSAGGYPYDASPGDFIEGKGMGEMLQPSSQYSNQLEKRFERSGYMQDNFTVNFNARDAITGEPLAGCLLSFDEQSGLTDTDGKITFTGVPAFILLDASMLHYLPIENMQCNFYKDTTLTVILEPQLYDVVFFVKDDYSQLAIPEVQLTLGEQSGITDAFGKALFLEYAGDYPYTLSKEGYETLSGTVTVEEYTNLNLEMLADNVGVFTVDSQAFRMWPNPVRKDLYVSFEKMDRDRFIRVLDINGVLLYEDNARESLIVPTAELPPGVYILNIVSEGHTMHKMFVKK